MNFPSVLVRRRTLLAGTAAALAAPLVNAQQDYPSKPLRLVVPSAPGSSADITARTLTAPLAAGLGQPVLVENVSGAGSVIGTHQIARARKDGYTAGVVTNLTISPYVYKLPYDPTKDVIPVTIMVSGPMVLLVNPKVPARNLADLLKLAKSRPASAPLTCGNAGIGTVGHLATALMMEMAPGATFLHVPYKGGNAFTTDLVGGQVDVGFNSTAVAGPLVRNGSLRAIAVTSAHRASSLPDVPTMAEAGLPGYELVGAQMAIVPAGTPPAIIQRLNTEFVRALHTPEVTKAAEVQGFQIVASTVDEAAHWAAREFELYGKLAQRIGLKPEN